MTQRIRIRHDAHYSYVATPTLSAPRLPVADIAYDLVGEGPEKVVLIAGMCVSHEMWHHQVDFLLAQQKYSLLLIDNRGVGHSSIPTDKVSDADGFNMVTMARDVLAVIDSVFGTASQIHVVGHSMGSMIAQRLALMDLTSERRRIRSLSLLSGHDGGWFWNNFPTLEMIRAGWELITSGFEENVVAAAHLRMHYSPLHLEEFVVVGDEKVRRRDVYLERYINGIRLDRTRDGKGCTFWAHLMAVRTHSLSSKDAQVLRDATYPKVVVYGVNDRVVLPRASRELAQRIGAEEVAVEGGHFIIDEAKLDVNAILVANFDNAAR